LLLSVIFLTTPLEYHNYLLLSSQLSIVLEKNIDNYPQDKNPNLWYNQGELNISRSFARKGFCAFFSQKSAKNKR
jgi:hypothetical protein